MTPTLTNGTKSPMRILVTGAGGFVGDALCRRLSASGCHVVGIFREQPAARDWMEARAIGDLTQVRDFSNVVDGMDAVIHLAARVHMMRETATDPDIAFRQANSGCDAASGGSGVEGRGCPVCVSELGKGQRRAYLRRCVFRARSRRHLKMPMGDPSGMPRMLCRK